MTDPTVQGIYVGGPKTLRDEQGEFISSIARTRVDLPVEVRESGIVGDRVMQPYHGGPSAALCVHLTDHYRFWDEHGIYLTYGGLGENLVVDGITEDEVLVGDIVQVGTAELQVSGPRMPCGNQARHVGRSDWVKLTVREARTGFYTRVLRPGFISTGDPWRLLRRSNFIASITALNRCYYLEFDPDLATEFVQLDGLAHDWKERFLEKLSS